MPVLGAPTERAEDERLSSPELGGRQARIDELERRFRDLEKESEG